MSSAPRLTRPAAPLLETGMRLTQPEFHARYERYPAKTKFELIGGVVYMASPLHWDHSRGDLKLSVVFDWYETRTPGVAAAPGLTTILGGTAEHQPDLVLRILSEFGGSTRTDQRGRLIGPPELVCEVSHTTQRLDYGPRLDDYARFGVAEYVVFDAKVNSVRWFLLPGRQELTADRSGVYKSRCFPGLWLNSRALTRGDSAALIATVEKGTKTAAHRKFVAKLASRRT